MNSLVYIIVTILIYGYVAGYMIKYHNEILYLKTKGSIRNFRYVSMIILTLIIGYIFSNTLTIGKKNDINKYFIIIIVALFLIIYSKYRNNYYSEEYGISNVLVVVLVFVLLYIGNELNNSEDINNIVKLIVAIIFIQSTRIIFSTYPYPFNLIKTFKNIENNNGLHTIIADNKITTLKKSNEVINYQFDGNYKINNGFALTFDIYIEPGGRTSEVDSSYDLISINTRRDDSNDNIDFTIIYNKNDKNLYMYFNDQLAYSLNDGIENTIKIPIEFNSNNLYKWHTILLNFRNNGLDIYTNNNNFSNVRLLLEEDVPIKHLNLNGNRLIQTFKFKNPLIYSNFYMKNINVGNSDNLGNDYISFKKFYFISRTLNNEELNKIIYL